ncbi:replication endonuclease, partial [Aliarcobacter butzleri]
MNKKIEETTNYYKNVFDEKMKAKSAYLSKLKIKDLGKNELINLNTNVEYMIKNDYLCLVFNSIALQEKYENNNDYCALFLTLTLDSPFHQFKENENKELIKNSKFTKGNTVNLGYKVLNAFFKSLYKDFKVNNQFVKIEFIRVFEPHADFTPHLHSLIYIKKEHLNLFEKYLINKI